MRGFPFHQIVSRLTHNVETRDRPEDDLLVMVLAKARRLSLPVTAFNVQFIRTGGEVRIVADVGQASWPVGRIRRIALSVRLKSERLD